MSITNYARGVYAEMWAAVYLWIKGYRIRARRYKTKVGEIDLIVTRGRVIVFVEVKMRDKIDTALGAIQPQSYDRIRRAAAWFIARHPLYQDYTQRIDLVALSPPCQVRHVVNIL